MINQSGDDVRVAYPLFQRGSGGALPTSPLQFYVGDIPWQRAITLNEKWHSRLPLYRVGCKPWEHCKLCFGASFEGIYYAIAIWSHPCARLLPQNTWLELRRMAISPEAPKNTASRFLKVMISFIKKRLPQIEMLISYQDTEVHTGTIYKASGWFIGAQTKGSEWHRPNIGRYRPPVQSKADKIRWQKEIK